jgi:hypothetical protein
MEDIMLEHNQPFVQRVLYGKIVGLIIGIIALISMVYLLPETGWTIRIATMLYYTTIGAVVGMVCIDIDHPVLGIEFKWWVTSIITGAWMNFNLVLFFLDEYEAMLSQSPGFLSNFSSPVWLVLDGAIAGLIIGVVVHRKVGEPAQQISAS